MAWGSAGLAGFNSKKAAGTLVVTLTAALEAGNVGVITVAADNISTTDGETTQLSLTDSGGNTWTRALEYTNGQGTAATGVVCGVFYSVITVTVGIGGTVTLTNTPDVTAKSMIVWEFTKTLATVQIAGSAALAEDNADPGDITVGSLQNSEHLFVYAYAGEQPGSDTFATESSYTDFGFTGTSGGLSAENVQTAGGFRILTGTTSTVNANATSTNDLVSILVAFDEIAAGLGAAGSGGAMTVLRTHRR